MDYRAVCLDVCELAREAGAYIARQRERFTFSDVEFKGAQNLVSYVDKQTERTLVERLKALVPEAEFVTEEGTVSAAGGASRLKWIVDPLDGTTNFVHGLSPYCVSIALTEEDEPVVGVVYEVTRDEMFYAWRGSYAYLNGERIVVSQTDRLENSLIAIGFAYGTVSKTALAIVSYAFRIRPTACAVWGRRLPIWPTWPAVASTLSSMRACRRGMSRRGPWSLCRPGRG